MNKRFLAVLTVLALICAPVPTIYAQQTTQCNNANQSAFAHETLTVSTTAKILTASVYNPGNGQLTATSALVSIQGGQNVRVWFDGTAPTTSAGIVVKDGQTVVVCGFPGLQKFQMIRDDGTDAEAAVQYFAPAQ